MASSSGTGGDDSRVPVPADAECVCAEINIRHCPVHGQGEAADRPADVPRSTAPRDGLSWQQEASLRCLRANDGEAHEDTIAMEGLTSVRITMKSLERRKLVTRGRFDYIFGYAWSLA